MACGLSTEMELELESIGFWGETITGIPGEKTLGADLLKEPTANSTVNTLNISYASKFTWNWILGDQT